MSLEKAIMKNIEMQVAVDRAMNWKPKGFTNATRFLIRFLAYVLTFIWFGFNLDDPFLVGMGDFFIWVTAYKVLKVLLLGLHLALLTKIPRVPIGLMEELGVPNKVIGTQLRKWYWKHT